MRRDLGNRASPVNRAHMKRPLNSIKRRPRSTMINKPQIATPTKTPPLSHAPCLQQGKMFAAVNQTAHALSFKPQYQEEAHRWTHLSQKPFFGANSFSRTIHAIYYSTVKNIFLTTSRRTNYFYWIFFSSSVSYPGMSLGRRSDRYYFLKLFDFCLHMSNRCCCC